MGVWNFPFRDISTAKLFAQKMRRPWLAKVTKDEEYGYNWSAVGLAGLGSVELYGSDSLFDYLFEIATKKKKTFDVRPYVTECLKYDVWYHLHQSPAIYDAKALNIVADSIGLVVEKQRAISIQSHINNLLQHLKDNSIKLLYAETYVRDNKVKWTMEIPREVPTQYKKKQNIALLLTTEKKYSLGKLLKQYAPIHIKTSKEYKQYAYVIMLYLNVPMLNQKQELVFKSASSNKFWSGWVEKRTVYVRFGVIGKEGRATKKSFTTPEKAQQFLETTANGKLRKGYVRKGG